MSNFPGSPKNKVKDEKDNQKKKKNKYQKTGKLFPHSPKNPLQEEKKENINNQPCRKKSSNVDELTYLIRTLGLNAKHTRYVEASKFKYIYLLGTVDVTVGKAD